MTSSGSPKLVLRMADDICVDLIALLRMLRLEVDPNDLHDQLKVWEYVFHLYAIDRLDIIREAFHNTIARQAAANLDDELLTLLDESGNDEQ